jgi:hypothetical protein
MGSTTKLTTCTYVTCTLLSGKREADRGDGTRGGDHYCLVGSVCHKLAYTIDLPHKISCLRFLLGKYWEVERRYSVRTYKPEDFVKELISSDVLPLPAPPVVQTGMVDPAESGQEELSFAPGTQYSNWVKVPLSIIEQVDHLSNQRYGQDEYPYVRLHLKCPGTKEGDAIFQALASMLLQPGTAPEPMVPLTRPFPTTPVTTTAYPTPPPASQHTTPANQRTRIAPTPPNMPGPTRGCG